MSELLGGDIVVDDKGKEEMDSDDVNNIKDSRNKVRIIGGKEYINMDSDDSKEIILNDRMDLDDNRDVNETMKDRNIGCVNERMRDRDLDENRRVVYLEI